MNNRKILEIGRKVIKNEREVYKGIPSFFVHSTEVVHGDLGMLKPEDVVIGFSNSGETQEVINLLPILKRRGIRIIALTSKENSTLGENSDITINIGCNKEACPFNLVSTSSSTATLVLGDALVLTSSQIKAFTKEEYALDHPGGSLGEKIRELLNN